MRTGPRTRIAAAAALIACATALAVPGSATATTGAAPGSAGSAAVAVEAPSVPAVMARARALASGSEWRLCMYLGGHTTVQMGSTGEPVRHLQCILSEVYRYVNVPTNGVFEEVTKASVEHLQRAFGRTVTGVVDTATWAVLHP
ncbi:peptidoglycan-binding domain-containing protein [Streptomyces jumonjinensis]|uniref:Peptidoglycan-binding protein n=1 Tax=Streptomyces jumonjinensis TaxID=1945 RepID=A0A646KTF0_STRJU|nr:peptidoglycan-binding domain-containing protein [Streptomyces jumonjinensis]MQT05582.1 peptidoglycan-binding protein [Streptomyces jumonjinensis]